MVSIIRAKFSLTDLLVLGSGKLFVLCARWGIRLLNDEWDVFAMFFNGCFYIFFLQNIGRWCVLGETFDLIHLLQGLLQEYLLVY